MHVYYDITVYKIYIYDIIIHLRTWVYVSTPGFNYYLGLKGDHEPNSWVRSMEWLGDWGYIDILTNSSHPNIKIYKMVNIIDEGDTTNLARITFCAALCLQRNYIERSAWLPHYPFLCKPVFFLVSTLVQWHFEMTLNSWETSRSSISLRRCNGGSDTCAPLMNSNQDSSSLMRHDMESPA